MKQPQELRELDAWLAEHVMGFVWYYFPEKKKSGWCALMPKGKWKKRHGGKVVFGRVKNIEVLNGDVPCYSTKGSRRDART